MITAGGSRSIILLTSFKYGPFHYYFIYGDTLIYLSCQTWHGGPNTRNVLSYPILSPICFVSGLRSTWCSPCYWCSTPSASWPTSSSCSASSSTSAHSSSPGSSSSSWSSSVSELILESILHSGVVIPVCDSLAKKNQQTN